MAVFVNTNTNSPVASVEFSPRPDSNFAFIYGRSAQDKDKLHEILTAPDIGQEIISETVVDGKPVFITRGEKTQAQLSQALAGHDVKLAVPVPEKKFNPWAWRGHFSNIGQGLNLYSSLFTKGKFDKQKVDPAKLGFAALNLTANAVNIVFGGQKSTDPHHLRVIKQEINNQLTPYLPDGTQPISIEQELAPLHKEADKPKTFGQKFYDFMKANSVRVGEIGLRILGSLAMVFPVKQWGAAFKEIGKGSFKEAFKAGLNNQKDKTNLYTGVIYLIGKTIGFFSKVPDPYNPKPNSWFDNIREKVFFRLSSSIEMVAAGTLAYGNIKKKDTIGALGGATLVSGLGTRLFAKFGTKEVNMEEVYAHVVDNLAKIPADKIPLALNQTAVFLTEHFKNKAISFGEVYSNLESYLYKFHDIAVHAENSIASDIETKTPKFASPELKNKIEKPQDSFVAQTQQPSELQHGIA